MMKQSFFSYSMIVLLLFSMISCGRSHHHRSDNNRHSRTVPTVPVNPELPTKTEEEIEPVRNLPTSPKILFHVTRHSLYSQAEFFERYDIGEDMQKLIIACDYKNTRVRNKAVSLAGRSPGEFNLGQVCEIFDYCYKRWKYVNDPISGDYYSPASETLENGLNGDCDDFAILMCSMILSIGGEARINFAYGNDGGHAFTEVNIGYTEENEVYSYLIRRYGKNNIMKHIDNLGNNWLNLDWQAGYPGGKYWNYNGGISLYIIQNFCENL